MDRGKYEEYGCGHYGCVLPVPDGRIVLKVTSDPTEAAFVAIYLGLKDKPLGIVRYHQIVQLPEKYRRRPTYAIWRDEAEHVGGTLSLKRMLVYRERYGRDINAFDRNLSHFKNLASDVRDIVVRSTNRAKLLEEASKAQDWAWSYVADDHLSTTGMTAPRKLAVVRRRLEVLAEEMGSTAAGYLVGEALGELLDQGILLADVHHNNIGEVDLPDYSKWEFVITDPGHMVALDPKWFEVEIPQL